MSSILPVPDDTELFLDIRPNREIPKPSFSTSPSLFLSSNSDIDSSGELPDSEDEVSGKSLLLSGVLGEVGMILGIGGGSWVRGGGAGEGRSWVGGNGGGAGGAGGEVFGEGGSGRSGAECLQLTWSKFKEYSGL